MIHTILFTLYLYSTYYDSLNRNLIFILEMIFIVLIVLNEFISFLSLRDSYFKDFLNYFDICSIILALVVLIMNKHEIN